MEEMMDYIIEEKGMEVISERHRKDFKKEEQNGQSDSTEQSTGSFTDLDFDDI